MRLIDADALVKKICFRCKEGDGEGMCAEFCRFIAALDNTPTIDAVPVVHARWEYGVTLNHEWRKCSKCLVSQDICGCFTYCPNCGAKMDGGADDGNA